jgi:hypothetical protein
MSTLLSGNTDFSVVVASLSGALVYMLARHHFNRRTRPLIFFVSFTMGICGADFTLELIKALVPDVYCNDERAVGAFVCSALVVTVMFGLMRRVDIILKGHKDTKNDE